MRLNRFYPSSVWLFFTAITCSQQLFAQPAVVKTNFTDQWLKPAEIIEIELDREVAADEGELRILIGDMDVTGLVSFISPEKLHIDTSLSPLPSGDTEVSLFLATGPEEWEELDQLELRILTKEGLEVSEVEPRLDISNKSQWDQGHSEDAGEPDRDTFHDVAGQGGVSTRHRKGDFEVRSSVNLIGSSVIDEALQFDSKGDEADKVDLADYLVEVEKGRTAFSVGHIEYGTNPLMLDNLAHRGVALRHAFGSRFDLSLSNLSGRSIVGFNQFLGGTSSNRISAVTAGLEVLKQRPGGLRMELMYMDGERENDLGFRVGEVPDSEQSHGLGVRLIGSTPSGRLRGDLSYGRSTYENPEDPVLDQGDATVAVEKSTDDARHVSLAFDILQDLEFGESQFSTVTLELTHDRNDPFYRSLGAFVSSDLMLNQGTLTAQMGDFVNAQLLYGEAEDNLDDISTILKTKTRQGSANLNISLPSMFGDPEAETSFWPVFSYVFDHVHQFADNSPEQDQSGFNGGSHLPDQVSLVHDGELNWFFNRWDFGYRFSFSDQDNRQPGRENDDFKNYGHTVSVGLRFLEGLSVGLSAGRERNDDIDNALRGYTDRGGIDLLWQFARRWAFSGSYHLSRVHDSNANADDRDFAAFAQLSRTFELPFGQYRLPGQIFVSYSQTELDSQNNQFAFNTLVRNWSVNSGVSLSFF